MSPKRPDAIDVLVGHNIRIQRHAKGVSQTELAQRVGVTFRPVQKYEGGVNRVGAGRRASPPCSACRSPRCSTGSRADRRSQPSR
ncbi:MAG: helix-turn-helix domain-containing protein [Xanthobacteraceae bacterium]